MRDGTERTEAAGEQLSLLRAVASRHSPSRHTFSRHTSSRALATAFEAAAVDPVAVVVVDVGLPHLDRTFEYRVPAALAERAVPGARVRVRFAGQDVDGFIVQRRAVAEHEGTLAPLRRVVSPEAVLTPTLLAVARAVASRYAGTLGDVLRLAIPPRHATAEKNLPMEAPEPAPAAGMATPLPVPARDPGPWADYPAGPAFLRRVAMGEAPAASWLGLPSRPPEHDWPAVIAVAAATALSASRGALIVVPDHRDVDRVDAALGETLGPGRHVRLTAEQGPQARYTAWLKVLRGHTRCVVGTRAAMFAPVMELGLVAWWDDGDDLLSEPRAPYPHVREVLEVRARLEGAALLSGGFARTTAMQLRVHRGDMAAVDPAPLMLRRSAPRVVVAGEGADVERDGPAARAHLPSLAWRTAKAALEKGPVLVQVPRRGYVPSLSCRACRSPARCRRCHGPLALRSGDADPWCRWCGTVEPAFECPHCEARSLRSTVVGARRTAEELGRAFPGVPVRTSGSGEVLASVGATPSLVIATPGAEPLAEGRYAATLLLDAWALLDRPALDASEESLRRWLAAGALTRGAADGGAVVLCGAPTHTTLPVVEALVRWDPAWFAARELAERVELSLPPAVLMAQLVGPRAAVQQALSSAVLPPSVERIGPIPYHAGRPRRSVDAAPRGLRGPLDAGDEVEPRVQVLLRAPLDGGPSLAAALTAMKAVRSARKERDAVSVRIDPVDSMG